MDNLYGFSDSKVPKRSSLSPISNFGAQNPYYHYKAPVIDHYASPDGHNTVLKNPNSPFLRYLQSSRSLLAAPSSIGGHSPLAGYKYHRSNGNRTSESSSRLEPQHQPSSPLFFRNTNAKVEEDVLVMDGVVVKNSPVDRGKSPSPSLTDSGGSLSSGAKNYKMDLCLSYLENSGFCRYGNNCQFAHGNKELRASQMSYKSTLETPCKNYIISATTQTMSPSKNTSCIVNLKTTDWSPLDDDIEIRTENGSKLSEEEVEADINKFLYGPRKVKRLPVFDKICPQS